MPKYKNTLRTHPCLWKDEEFLFWTLHKVKKISCFSVNVRQCNITYSCACTTLFLNIFITRAGRQRFKVWAPFFLFSASVFGPCPYLISICETLMISAWQPHSQALSSPERKTLVGSGHVLPTFWVLANKINVEDVLKIYSCSYLA